MTGEAITTIAELEAVIGKTPPPMHLKVIDHLDSGAMRWISASPLMFAGVGTHSQVGLTLAGGVPGFADGEPHRLRVPVELLDEPALLQPGAAFGSLFLVPGIGETLRVNGRISVLRGEYVEVTVDECYGHCAKALIRSEFWSANPNAAPVEAVDFIAASRFLGLATMAANGRADLSPKGDPAGCMVQLDGNMLWFADRPGNRRVDSFRNLIEQPEMALALLIPGSSRIACVRGQAHLTTCSMVRERFTVRNKTPSLVIGVQIERLEMRDSPALAGAALWPAHLTSDIDPAKMFVEHIKLNRIQGIGARLARASLAVPGMTGLLKKGLNKDYKDNLY